MVAHTMKQPRVDPTPYLPAAFKAMRLPGRPATLTEALADDCCRPLLECMARQMARQALQRAHTPAPVSPALHRAGLPVPRHARPWAFDARRAAANDLDD